MLLFKHPTPHFLKATFHIVLLLLTLHLGSNAAATEINDLPDELIGHHFMREEATARPLASTATRFKKMFKTVFILNTPDMELFLKNNEKPYILDIFIAPAVIRDKETLKQLLALGLNISHLHMRQCGIYMQNEGISDVLAEYLETNNKSVINSLSLRDCHISKKGLGKLLKSLVNNSTIHTLDLSGNTMDGAGASNFLIPLIERNSTLRKLYLEHTKLDTVVKKSIKGFNKKRKQPIVLSLD